MNHRERFRATMHYQPVDRCPLYDFNFWDETIPEWHKQGLPETITLKNTAPYFGLDYSIAGGENQVSAGVGLFLQPLFEEKILEDRGENEVVQQGDGVRVVRGKYMGSIPMHEGHLLVDRASWDEHYKPRLDPSTPGRFPENWQEKVAKWKDPDRSEPLFLWGGSLYGWLRNWWGVENLSYVVYDDPAFFEEMVETVADLGYSMISKVLETGVQFDACSMWEDMCYNGGPLLSPEHFKKYLVPRYRRLTDLLHKHNCDIVWLDCDGKIDDLLPMWLDAGVNCMFPIEIGTWNADPIKFRRQYGKNLRMMGGFDKHVLSLSKQAIEDEIHRLVPLVEEGGFIPMPDHRVPPDVPLENYKHYCKVARQIWGKNTNLRPAECM